MSRKKILSITLAILFITFSFLTGCASNKENNSNNSAKKTSVESDAEDNSSESSMDKIQEYTYVTGNAISTLDPTLSSSTPVWAAQAPIYEGLTRYITNPDGDAIVVEGVAKSWTISDDGLKYTFDLREDAKWSDGTPLTANDFVYTFQRVFDPEIASAYSWMLEGIIKNGTEYLNGDVAKEEVGVKAINDYTLEIELERPCGYFLILAGFPTYKPVKKEFVEKCGEEYGSTQEMVLGNGPYMISNWEQNVKIEYVPNPHYWDKENVFLDKLTRKRIEESAVAAQALLNGEVDCSGGGPAEWREVIDQDDRFNLYDGIQAGNEFFMFNPTSKYLKNKKIRQAISVAIDRESFINEINDGRGEPLYAAVPSITAIGQDNFNKKVNGKNEYVKTMIEEIDDPKAWLIEGLEEEGLDPDPSKVSITFITRGVSEFSKKQAEWLKQKLNESLGIEIVIRMTDWNVMNNTIQTGEFEIAMGGWSADYNDPSTFLDCFDNKVGYFGKKIGWTGEAADQFSELISKAQNETNHDERAKIFVEAEKVLLDDAVIAPIYTPVSGTYRAKYVKEIYDNPFVYNDYKGAYIQGK